MANDTDRFRTATLTRMLRGLALGDTTSTELVGACLDAASSGQEAAWVELDSAGARAQAADSDARRGRAGARGRLDGVPVAVESSLAVSGLRQTLGLGRDRAGRADADSTVAARLRGAGAVLLGTTSMDELGLGTLGRPAGGPGLGNPLQPGRAVGGAACGAAVAVASGQVAAAVAVDTLGSVRIPAAFCGLVGLRPTHGEISRVGQARVSRRLDTPGILARSVSDVAILLQTLIGYDPGDVASRARRVPLAMPDWDPMALRVGVVSDLDGLGAEGAVQAGFSRALEAAGATLGHAQPAALRLGALEIAHTRRSALLLLEADLAAALDPQLEDSLSPRVQRMLAYARQRSAADAMAADARLDGLVVEVRELFERFDVLVLPTAPSGPPAIDADEPANLADFTALASLAGCPALSLPLPDGHGLQLVGPRGSDLRLLELGEVVHSVVEAALHATA